MLFLIFPYRNNIAVVNQNVGRHQHRVGEQAGGRSRTARDLVLVGMRELQSRGWRYGRKNPGELGHMRHIALEKKRRLIGVQSTGQEIELQSANVSARST